MDIHHLNALRLGFSTSEAAKIKQNRIAKYVSIQLDSPYYVSAPQFVIDGPRNEIQLRALQKDGSININHTHRDWRAYFLQRCFETELPTREKINLFIQNHFVTSQRKVRVPYYYQKYYETINDYSLKNYKDLVKAIVYTNAMIVFLDNYQNRKGKINENLARELLELFTLGEGNYTERDIRNTALALAGLFIGQERGEYIENWKDKSVKTVFGKSGNFIIDDVIEIIFEQKNTPYLFAEKALKWFFYDNPSQDKINFYGDVLKNENFELKPFFTTLFIEECKNPNGGNQIKNPLIFYFQIAKDLNLKPNFVDATNFLDFQEMRVFNQDNVKGWSGGRFWLTAQLLKSRHKLVDQFIKRIPKNNRNMSISEDHAQVPRLKLSSYKPDAIKSELISRMIFQSNESIEFDIDDILNYEFDSEMEPIEQRALQVYAYLAKTPEFQII
jgi:uncharacterized protein (DUF1800 family)